jgi:serine/threonine-protein kinase
MRGTYSPMDLSPGTRIGPYEVISLVGVGGMGEVYRARDPRLQRDVALKILPAAFSADPDRIARFEREARTLAALNHPHIAGIYGFEESNGIRTLALEFVAGETLADRVTRGPIPLEEALSIARQIADALEAAHDQKIIHRDLKPANIKLRPDGTVKVLDFGLAKGLSPAAASSTEATLAPTVSSPAMTRLGVVLGTAAYMSPEQARGQAADERSDVWAFGCVLYELLTGRRAFPGDDVTDTLAAVLRTEPDWVALPDGLPPAVQTLLRKCLEKDRRHRVANVSTAGFVIQELRDGSFSVASRNMRAQPRWRFIAPIFIAVGITAALSSAAWWIFRPSPAVTTTRFAVMLGEGQRFASQRRHVAISPDGRQFAYYVNDQLYVRSMSDLVARPIPGTQQPLTTPVFSPDGASIVFGAGRTLKRIQVEGGTPTTVANLAAPIHGMSWHDDTILLGHAEGGVWRVAASGGTPEQVIAVAKDEAAESPQMLPDGRSVLASGADNLRWERTRIVVQAIGSATRTTLIDGGADGKYLRTGHIVFARGGALFAVRYDPRRASVTGLPVPVVEGIRRSPFATTGAAHYSISTTGALVYMPGPSSTALVPTDLALIDRKGVAQALKLPPRLYEFPRASPDGKRIAFGTDDLKEADIWILDMARAGPPRQFTTGGRTVFLSGREMARGSRSNPIGGGITGSSDSVPMGVDQRSG